MTWNHDELIRSLPRYERDLEADGLLHGRETRVHAATEIARVDEAQLGADLAEYQECMAASSTPNAIHTYGYSEAIHRLADRTPPPAR